MERLYERFAACWGAEGQRLNQLKRMRHMARYWLRRDQTPLKYRGYYAGATRWRP